LRERGGRNRFAVGGLTLGWLFDADTRRFMVSQLKANLEQGDGNK
jgi:hypothetical protein